MNTVFLLMAEFNTPTIPLSQIAEKYLGMTIATANKKANCGELALPSFRLDQGQKAPRIVHIQDLADYIDEKRLEAKKELDMVNN